MLNTPVNTIRAPHSDTRPRHSAANRTVGVIAAVNDDHVLQQNLMRSPMIADGAVELTIERGHQSAGSAYNAGMEHSDADVLVFAHQDVYFPPHWEHRLARAIDALETRDRNWGVLGVWGVTSRGGFRGRVWCSGSNREFIGVVRDVVEEVESIDEIVIVVRRDSGLRFDPKLPAFHLYATDLVLTAKSRGLRSYVFDGPVVHNSRTVPQLDRGYVRASRYMRRKWRSTLPVRTPVVPLTRLGAPLHRYRLKAAVNVLLGRVTYHARHDSPVPVSRRLGYEA